MMTKDKKNKRKRNKSVGDSVENSGPTDKRFKNELPVKNSSEINELETSGESKKIKKKAHSDEKVEGDLNENVNIEDSTAGEKTKKRNKKKKKPDTQSSDVPESKMSKRQLKREKHAQRMAEAEAASHKAVQMQALSYLSLWKYNKAEWKFNKVRQIWLYKHKFDNDKIPEELWQPFIEYFSSASGSIKQLIIDDCQKVIEQMEKWLETKDEADKSKPSDFMYQRARDLLQNIS